MNPPLIAFLFFLNERDLRTFDFFLCDFVFFLNVLDLPIIAIYMVMYCNIIFLSIFSRFTQLNLSNMVTDGTQSHMLGPSKTGSWVS